MAENEEHQRQLLDAYLVVEPGPFGRAYVKASVEVNGQVRYIAIPLDSFKAQNVDEQLQRLAAHPTQSQA